MRYCEKSNKCPYGCQIMKNTCLFSEENECKKDEELEGIKDDIRNITKRNDCGNEK